MLKNSFIHIPGIGKKTEKQLWDTGLLGWEHLESDCLYNISPKQYQKLINFTNESIKQLENNNLRFFSDLLPSNEHWRLFPHFRSSTAYLDIETTGIKSYDFEITTIALYDGESVKYYVKGQNLEAFMDDILHYEVIVTYNGKTFDVPFIEEQFGIKSDQTHIDLRYVLKSLGYTGGLKRCETALGIDRGDLDGVDGYFSVLLWLDYQKNNNGKALETLLAYNIEDVVNLETLMVTAYNMKIRDTPFCKSHQLELPVRPEIPFKPDSATIDRLKKQIVRSSEAYIIDGC
jgi:uncharacterized protein YprB with RNaseH-like and TPR domain